MITKTLSSSAFRQYLAGFLCSLSMAMLSSSICWVAPAIPKLQGQRADVNLTNNEVTWMVSSLYLGAIVSPIPSGYLIDRFGRKMTLIFATAFNTVTWIILYFAISPYQFYVARFLCGVSTGAFYMITPIYIGEISEPNIRGSIANMVNITMNFTSVYIYSIGMYVSYKELIIAALVIPIMFISTFVWMPETPYYYLIKDERDKAAMSLGWFRCDKSSDDVTNELKFIELNVKNQMKMKSSFKEVISSKANRKALFTVLFVSGLQRLTGYGAIIAYSSVILPQNSLSFLSFNQCIILLSISWFVTPIISALFINKCNRRPLLLLSSFGCGLMNLAAAVWFFLDKDTGFSDLASSITWVPLLSFLCHAEFYAAGVGPTSSSIRGELFAVNIKGKAAALVGISTTVISFFINKFFLTVSDVFGMYMNFVGFSIACFVSVIFIYFYVIETKGKTLEQIQDELNGELKEKPIKI